MAEGFVFADSATIMAAREENFAATMDLVVERHPWYRAIMAERGLKRDDFATLADIVKLPVTEKRDYMSAPEDFRLDTTGLASEMTALWDVMYTTGTTTGRPTPLYSTTWDFYDILTLQRGMLELRGVRDDDIIANLFPLTVWPHGAYARVPHAAAVMNIPVVSALPGNPSEHFRWGRGVDEVVALVTRRRATILWGVASYIRRVLIRALELDADFSAVRLVFITGEAAPEALRSDLANRLAALGARDPFVSISYGATEMQGGLVECAPGSGYHNPAPDQYLIEVVDPATGAPVADGERGLVLLSHLRRRGTVLLRYALGDVAILSHEKCPHCGASAERLVSMPERIDSLVKIKGTLVNPDLIGEAIMAEPGVEEYQVVIERSDAADRHSPDRLTLRLALSPGADAPAIAERVKRASGVTPEIALTPRDEIFKPGDTLKSKRFVDLRREAG
jgi:phenylacetate-coenzyme A ligase PaaK-like adenylate-forming protein